MTLDLSIMSGRLWRLRMILKGLEKTGIPLLGYDGSRYFPGEKGDDPGLFYFVPKIMSLFHVSLNAAISIFFLILIVVPFVVGLIGLERLKWKTGSIQPVMHLALFVFSALSCDVYITSYAAVIAIIPWVIYFVDNFETGLGSGWAFFPLAGLFLGACASIRSFSSTPVLVFFTFYGVSKTQRKGRWWLMSIFVLGLILPGMFFVTRIFNRDEFLLAHRNQSAELTSGQHVVWHPICLGLSFLNNDYGVPRNDQEVEKSVAEISSAKLPSTEYENVVRGMVFQFARNHPYFVFRTIFAKAGVLLFYALAFGNVGLFLALKNFRLDPLNVAFVLGIASAALPGLAVTPYHYYVLGFISFVTLYGIYGFSTEEEL